MNTFNIRSIHWCVMVPLLLFLGGCTGKSLPESKKNYAGKWEGSGITLQITQGGRVNYKKEQGSSKVTINAPIKEFENDNLVVGVWFFTTTFVVQQTPVKEGERWAMVVDGNKLYRVN